MRAGGLRFKFRCPYCECEKPEIKNRFVMGHDNKIHKIELVACSNCFTEWEFPFPMEVL